MKFLLFLLIVQIHFTFAQTDSLLIDDFNKFINVSADFYTSPVRFDSEDWIKLSSVIGITAIASLADKEVRSFAQQNQSKFADDIFNIDKYYYIEFVGASIVAFYGYGLIGENNKIRKLAVKLTEATFLATSITVITKTVVGRGRPYQQESQYFFNPFTFDNDYNSFPSGHTSLAFAYSTVMANEIDNFFWKIGWYSLAGLVGYARIYHNQHWFSDVLMGAAIGYFSGEFVNNHDSNANEQAQFNIIPFPNGIAVQLRF
ncbi:MAG: phosphatase PAP2 family protein [Ignavibacterium sp.]|nr:phosphatase PAP2 family protein [Ignavibacterium sp.]